MTPNDYVMSQLVVLMEAVAEAVMTMMLLLCLGLLLLAATLTLVMIGHRLIRLVVRTSEFLATTRIVVGERLGSGTE